MPTLSWTSSAPAKVSNALPHEALRERIAWLCQLTRAVAVGWAVWMLVSVVRVWADPAQTARIVGSYLNADLGTVTSWEIALGFTVHIISWLPGAAGSYCVWRLFEGYLNGRIFTADAAAWVQRIGIVGLITVAIGIVGRRIDWLILTSHSELSLSTRLLAQLIVPTDLLGVLFSLFVLAIGRVFTAAVEIADDNAGIV